MSQSGLSHPADLQELSLRLCENKLPASSGDSIADLHEFWLAEETITNSVKDKNLKKKVCPLFLGLSCLHCNLSFCGKKTDTGQSLQTYPPVYLPQHIPLHTSSSPCTNASSLSPHSVLRTSSSTCYSFHPLRLKLRSIILYNFSISLFSSPHHFVPYHCDTGIFYDTRDASLHLHFGSGGSGLK